MFQSRAGFCLSLIPLVAMGVQLFCLHGAFAQAPISAVAFSPDGKKVVAAAQSEVKIYQWPSLKLEKSVDLSKLRFTPEKINPLMTKIHEIQFHPVGKEKEKDKKEFALIVGGGVPKRKYSLLSLQWPTLKASRDYSWPFLDISHDFRFQEFRRFIASENTIQYMQTDGKVPKATGFKSSVWVVLGLDGHSDTVLSLELLPKLNLLLSGSRDQTIRVWNLKNRECVKVLDQHLGAVNDLRIRPGSSPENPIVGSCSEDKTIRFWQPKIGRMIRFCRTKSPVLEIAFSSDGKKLAAACKDGSLLILDPESAEIKRREQLIMGWAYSVAFAPDNKGVVIAGENSQIKSYSIID